MEAVPGHDLPLPPKCRLLPPRAEVHEALDGVGDFALLGSSHDGFDAFALDRSGAILPVERPVSDEEVVQLLYTSGIAVRPKARRWPRPS